MADSSEKVSFRVDMQCSSLRAEAFLVFDKGSQPTLGQQITDMRPTVGRQSVDKRLTVYISGGNITWRSLVFLKYSTTENVLDQKPKWRYVRQ